MEEPEFLTIDGIQCRTELVKDAARRCVHTALAINAFRMKNPDALTPTVKLLLSDLEMTLAGADEYA